MIPIYVPSRDRTWTFRSEFNPIRQMSMHQRNNVFYVVPDGDEELYRSDIPPHVGGIIPMRYENIADKRMKIGHFAAQQGHKYFMMVDDDVKWFTRVNEAGTKLRPSDHHDLETMFQMVEDVLEEGYSHVGVSLRQGNNNFGPAYPGQIEENTRCIRAVAFNTYDFNSCEHNRVPLMEDFDVSLQLLERGKKNAVHTFWAQDQKGTQTQGGCTKYRTKELHEAAAVKLAELHPEFVRLRDKENKSGGDFGTRKEVTISWKKAYASHRE